MLNLTRKAGEAIRYALPVSAHSKALVSFDVMQGTRGRVDIVDLPDEVLVYRTELIDRVEGIELNDPLGVYLGFVVNLDVVYNSETGEIPYAEVVEGVGFHIRGETPIRRGDDLARQLTGLIRDDISDGGDAFEALRDKIRGV